MKFIDSCRAQGLDFPSMPKEKWPALDENEFYLRTIAGIPDLRDPKYEFRIGQVFEAKRIVTDWRRANAKIVQKWQQYRDAAELAARAKMPRFSLRMRSGRVKTYFNPRMVLEVKAQIGDDGKPHPVKREALQMTTVLGTPPKYFTGGNIMENIVQGTCRDIMNYGAVEIEEKHPDWHFMFSVYDEVIFSVPEGQVETALKEMPEIMCRGDYIRDWTKGLRLEVEGGVSDRYMK